MHLPPSSANPLSFQDHNSRSSGLDPIVSDSYPVWWQGQTLYTVHNAGARKVYWGNLEEGQWNVWQITYLVHTISQLLSSHREVFGDTAHLKAPRIDSSKKTAPLCLERNREGPEAPNQECTIRNWEDLVILSAMPCWGENHSNLELAITLLSWTFWSLS